MLEEIKEVMELATNTTVFIKELLKLKSNNKGFDKDNFMKSSSGDSARIGSSGYYAQIGSSGNSARIGSSGYYAQIGSSGDSARIGSSGYYARIGSSGYSARIGSSGYYARIGSSGDSAQIGSSGDSARIGSSGYYARIESNGKDSVISGIGYKNIIKAKKGSWITLAEYDENYKPICVKSAQIDGEILKEDTYYCLYNKDFKEVQIIDEVYTIIEKRKKNVIKGRFLNDYSECYVIEKDGIYSHGKTVKEAKENLIYKISNRDKSMYENYNLDTILTKEEAIKMYRVITGSCEAGTKNFCKNNKIPSKLTVKKIIELTTGQYGNEILKEFFENKQEQINEVNR